MALHAYLLMLDTMEWARRCAPWRFAPNQLIYICKPTTPTPTSEVQ